MWKQPMIDRMTQGAGKWLSWYSAHHTSRRTQIWIPSDQIKASMVMFICNSSTGEQVTPTVHWPVNLVNSWVLGSVKDCFKNKMEKACTHMYTWIYIYKHICTHTHLESQESAKCPVTGHSANATSELPVAATQSTQRQYPYDSMWLCLSNTKTEVRGGGGPHLLVC